MFVKDSSGLVNNTDYTAYKAMVSEREQKRLNQKLLDDMEHIKKELSVCRESINQILRAINDHCNS